MKVLGKVFSYNRVEYHPTPAHEVRTGREGESERERGPRGTGEGELSKGEEGKRATDAHLVPPEDRYRPHTAES